MCFCCCCYLPTPRHCYFIFVIEFKDYRLRFDSLWFALALQSSKTCLTHHYHITNSSIVSLTFTWLSEQYRKYCCCCCFFFPSFYRSEWCSYTTLSSRRNAKANKWRHISICRQYKWKKKKKLWNTEWFLDDWKRTQSEMNEVKKKKKL